MPTAQGICDIPAHTNEDDVLGEVGPLEAYHHRLFPSLHTVGHRERAYPKSPHMKICDKALSLFRINGNHTHVLSSMRGRRVPTNHACGPLRLRARRVCTRRLALSISTGPCSPSRTVNRVHPSGSRAWRQALTACQGAHRCVAGAPQHLACAPLPQRGTKPRVATQCPCRALRGVYIHD